MEEVLVLALLFVASGITCFVATGVVKQAAESIGLVDRPDERKLHPGATPRVGGLAIIFGFGFPLLLFAGIPHAAALVLKNVTALVAVLASGSLIVGLGIYDDLVGADAPKKFVVQTAAAAILVAFGFNFSMVSLAGREFQLGVFGAIVSIVWIVGVINAINLIDGIDSLATIVSLTIAGAFVVIAILRRDAFSLVIMTALAGSLMGFIPWNRPPAKIFMGDTGSLFIGLLLAAVSIARPSKSPIALIVGGPMLALMLPVLDTLIVMKQRFGEQRSGIVARISRVFTADRRHIHHILVEKYGSTGRAILSIWVMTLFFAASAVMTVVQELKVIGYALGAVGVLLLFILRYRYHPPPAATGDRARAA